MATWDDSNKPRSEPNYSKAIPIAELRKIIDPVMLGLKGLGVFLGFTVAFYFFPSWRWTWRQRKLFHNHVVGRVVDMVPMLGEQRWTKLYTDFSRATTVDLVGRRIQRLRDLDQNPEDDETTSTTEDSEKSNNNTKKKKISPIRKRISFGYQFQEEEIRQAELQKENKEEMQDVNLALVEDACMPDTPLGCCTHIAFRARNVLRLEKNAYDTAVIFNTLCWEDPSIAAQRLKLAWSVVKPGGVLLLIDYGRPKNQLLGKMADYLESYKTTSLRLTMDYEDFIKENFSGEIETWPPEDYKRYLFGFRYTMVVQKKYQQQQQQKKEESESKSEEKKPNEENSVDLKNTKKNNINIAKNIF